MNAERARQFLQSFSPGDRGESTERAIEETRKNLDLYSDFEAQQALDSVVEDSLASLSVDSSGVEKLAATLAPKKRSLFLNPAVLASAAAVVCLAVVIFWIVAGETGGFDGMDEVESLVRSSENLSVHDFEPIEVRLDQLGDWFLMKGFEGFQAPPSMKELSSVGVRTFKFKGTSVACVAIPEGQMFLFVFERGALGVDPGNDWKILEMPPLVSASKNLGPMAVVVAGHGDRREMESFLKDPVVFARQAAKETPADK